MKKNVEILFICSLLFLVFSCASTPEYLYKEKAIALHLKSGPDLNLYDKKAHTLVLCVYQLRDPNAFNQLLDDEGGMSKLLACDRFDPGVTNSKRLVIQPDQDMTETLNRAEGTKYVGIVAGYYKSKRENMVRLKKVPIGIILRSPKKMKLGLYLGSQSIQEFRGK
jgi:type VI secretion system VasD/TssJ family lipoprotein